MAALRCKAELGCVGKPGLFLEGGSQAEPEGVWLVEQLSIGHAGLKLLDSHLRRFLRHQYNAQLHRRTQQIQEELVSELTSFGSRVFTAQDLSASSGELKHRWAISLAWSSGVDGRNAGGDAGVSLLN